jgi:dipeptidyl aminopeptidase/acylaminoacyl peptidase
MCQTDAGALVAFADGLNTTLARLGPADLTILSQHPGRLDSLTTTGIGEDIAVLTGSRYQLPNVHLGPPAGPLRRITDTRPELADITLGRQEPMAYRAADGLALDGLLVLPVGKTASQGPFPLVTIVHGGPYERYADECQLFWFPSAQWLAAAGYAVFLPNPRGGQGHGHPFAASVAGRVGKEEWTDIQSGIDLLVDRGIADSGRLGIAGWSHGGFMSAWAVGQTDRFRAALVGAGVTDWGMLAATGENGQFETALGGSTGWSGIGPHPHDAVSPISFAGRIRTPVLILHGAEDTNVPLGQGPVPTPGAAPLRRRARIRDLPEGRPRDTRTQPPTRRPTQDPHVVRPLPASVNIRQGSADHSDVRACRARRGMLGASAR